MLCRVDNKRNNLERECRLILLFNDVRGGDLAPGSVCGRARVDSEALVCELGDPLISFGGGEVVVEYFLSVFRINIVDTFLDRLDAHLGKSVTGRGYNQRGERRVSDGIVTNLKVYLHPLWHLGSTGGRLKPLEHRQGHDEHQPHSATFEALSLTPLFANALGCLSSRNTGA